MLCDEYGNCLHLFERDCSFQRRNQKMIEEAPCHALDDTIRQNMFEDALKACRYVGYTSAGTIEFLLSSDGKYYFMEMNTRIQVEHPITEQICGIDIIKQQIKIADHQRLNLKQEDIKANGYALECRINAEDTVGFCTVSRRDQILESSLRKRSARGNSRLQRIQHSAVL